MKKSSEVLYDAIALIEQRGWCQSSYTDAEGHLCAQGGVIIALGGQLSHPCRFIGWEAASPGGSTQFRVLTHALDAHLNKDLHDGLATQMTVYNDTPGRSAEEVLLMMKETAEELAALGE